MPKPTKNAPPPHQRHNTALSKAFRHTTRTNAQRKNAVTAGYHCAFTANAPPKQPQRHDSYALFAVSQNANPSPVKLGLIIELYHYHRTASSANRSNPNSFYRFRIFGQKPRQRPSCKGAYSLSFSPIANDSQLFRPPCPLQRPNHPLNCPVLLDNKRGGSETPLPRTGD